MVKFKKKVKDGTSKIIKAGANFGFKVLKTVWYEPPKFGYKVGRGRKK